MHKYHQQHGSISIVEPATAAVRYMYCLFTVTGIFCAAWPLTFQHANKLDSITGKPF